MKIVVTSQGTSLSDPLDPRFGRAKTFLVVDPESGEVSVHDNAPNLQAAQGAGIQAAQQVVELGAEAVITGHVGPKAFRALSAGGVRIYLAKAGTGQEALDLFKRGELEEQKTADVKGHWA